ncbi:MAG TPA: hypothetical protein VF795_09960 [Desulfuromonadaceae bacterium]
MNRIALVFFLLLTAVPSVFASGERSVTFFSDGALVELQAAAVKGIAEISLPGAMREESLRIKPLGNAVIRRVDILPSRRQGKGAGELARLLEQKSRLSDRLRALDIREEIFTSAAKAQSGKAPRKTKANPDPMQSIRQGTDFAIAQLEAVFTARRRAEQEIRRLDARIAALRKGERGQGGVARIAVTPNNGRLRVRYALEGEGWKPRYNLRLDNDAEALLTLYGQLPAPFAGYLLRVSPATLADHAVAPTFPAGAAGVVKLAEYRLPVREAHFGAASGPAFSLELTNSSAVRLPAGEAALYRSGEYWGRFRFEALSSARSRKVVPAGLPGAAD